MSRSEHIRCERCGRFVSFSDLRRGRAIHQQVMPDSHLSVEEWETYHVACERKAARIDAAAMAAMRRGVKRNSAKYFENTENQPCNKS